MYEGIVFCHRYHLDKLMATRDTKPESIRLAGGAAKSRVWTQMFADICGMPVDTVAVNETGALGCAITTAAATGAYASLEEAAREMCPVGERFEPDMAKHAVYEKRYALYRKAIECLDPLWDDMQAVIEGR